MGNDRNFNGGVRNKETLVEAGFVHFDRRDIYGMVLILRTGCGLKRN